jgi:hypothetical protein
MCEKRTLLNWKCHSAKKFNLIQGCCCHCGGVEKCTLMDLKMSDLGNVETPVSLSERGQSSFVLQRVVFLLNFWECAYTNNVIILSAEYNARVWE